MEAAVAVAQREETKTPQRSNFHEDKWDLVTWAVGQFITICSALFCFSGQEREREREREGTEI